jgi:hypothetical protein
LLYEKSHSSLSVLGSAYEFYKDLCKMIVSSNIPLLKVEAANFRYLIITITMIFINCNCVFTRWQWLIYMYTIAAKFTSGGPHEKHVVATWNFGNHLSIRF